MQCTNRRLRTTRRLRDDDTILTYCGGDVLRVESVEFLDAEGRVVDDFRGCRVK